jgi:hypothetical protein
VLACLDKTEWRDSMFNSSWTPLNKLPSKDMHDSPNARAIYLMTNSLIGANVFSSINTRLAAALDAQSKLTGFVSLPLAKEQWKLEVERLFNISLARIMINARDISRGAKGQYQGFVKLPKSEVDICAETYLMQTFEWKNINFTGMMWVLSVGLLVVVLAVPFTRHTATGEEDALFIEPVCNTLWKLLKKFGRLVVKTKELVMDAMDVMNAWLNGP